MDKVDEVTNLADDSAAAFLRIHGPMTARHPAGVNAIIDRQRRSSICEQLARLERQRREAAIKADHEMARRLLGRRDHSC